MKKELISLLLLFPVLSFSQMPFSAKTARTITSKNITVAGVSKDIPADEENDVTIFEEQTAGILFTDGGKLFPAISSSVIKYKFVMFSKKIPAPAGGAVTFKRVYLPFFVTSNVSGANLTSNPAASATEATSYFGSVMNFRVSPGKKISIGDENTLVLGTSHDLRILTIGDTVAQKVDIGFGYYGAAGLSYFGNGTATDPDGKDYGGKFGMSAIIYWFKSGGKFNKAVLNNTGNKDWLIGFEYLLKFVPSNKADSKFKLFLGAKYDFSRASPTKNTWNFRFGVGN
jgi:hypothetical protein